MQLKYRRPYFLFLWNVAWKDLTLFFYENKFKTDLILFYKMRAQSFSTHLHPLFFKEFLFYEIWRRKT